CGGSSAGSALLEWLFRLKTWVSHTMSAPCADCQQVMQPLKCSEQGENAPFAAARHPSQSTVLAYSVAGRLDAPAVGTEAPSAGSPGFSSRLGGAGGVAGSSGPAGREAAG